jgi:hypothetical protein
VSGVVLFCFFLKPATSKSKKRKRKSDSKKQKLNSDNSLPKNDNSRMNQVEIQNDNLGPTIDQTEDMHMEKAKEISVQEATSNKYVSPKLSFWISTWFILELSFLGSELSLLSF